MVYVPAANWPAVVVNTAQAAKAGGLAGHFVLSKCAVPSGFLLVGGVVSAANVTLPVGVPLIWGVTITVKVTVPPFFGSFVAVANAVVRLLLVAVSSVSIPLI